MLKLILMGIGLVAILLFLLWNQWNATRHRINGFLMGEVFLHGLEKYADASIKIKEAKREREKTLIVSIGVSILAVFIMVFYVIIARHTFINNHEHEYVETRIKEPTCDEEGILQYKCRYCEETYEMPVPVIDHSYVEIEKIEPTCKSKGAIISECNECGHQKTDYFGSVIDHDYEQIDCQDATCVQKGLKILRCRLCKEFSYEPIPLSSDHKYEVTSQIEATCEKEGITELTCEICGKADTRYTAVAEHTDVEVERTEPDCSKEGFSKKQCQICGREIIEVLPADGKHRDTIVFYHAEDHAVTYACSRCGREHKESLSEEEERSIWKIFEVYDESYHKREISEVNEREKNGRIDIADPVENYTRVKAKLSEEKQAAADCFSFTVTRKSNMRFFFSHEDKRNKDACYWYMTVYDTDGKTVIREGNIPRINKEEEYTFDVPELDPGTYYIKITRPVGENLSKKDYSYAYYYITLWPVCVQHELTKPYLLKEPTCTEDGEYINVCDECDEHVSTVIKALGHEWGEWDIIKEAEIWQRGEKERICVNCKVVEREDFLHTGSVIMMIAVGLVMIVIVCLMAVHKKRVLMTIIIIIMVALGIVFYRHFSAESKPADITPLTISRAEVEAVSPVKDDINIISFSFDGDPRTCWRDSSDGSGEGIVLTYYFEHPGYVAGMEIINGCVGGEEKYYENNRIQSMTLYFFRGGEVTTSVRLGNMGKDYSEEAEYYTLAPDRKDDAYYCEGIQIVIHSVCEGSSENADLCLTEIQFYERACE